MIQTVFNQQLDIIVVVVLPVPDFRWWMEAQAIGSEHDEEAIEQQLKYYRYALGMNMAQGPGWLVTAIIVQDEHNSIGMDEGRLDQRNKQRNIIFFSQLRCMIC
jgi:uncharacterized protein YlxW (UPF0749 family)